jgi:ferredoxin-NADP reductase
MFYADNHCTYTEQYEPEHTYTFTGKEMNSGKVMSVTVKAPDLFTYRQGEYIQVAFPYLSPEEREFLLSGMVFISE